MVLIDKAIDSLAEPWSHEV